MGAMMTQRPTRPPFAKCRCSTCCTWAISRLRSCGSRNTAPPKSAEQFKWLYAYSPYHHVKAGTEDPCHLSVTADTDSPLTQCTGEKTAALMQAEAKNGASKTRPILLRIESKAGHVARASR